jgi:DNA-binding response OmpR family regulator
VNFSDYKAHQGRGRILVVDDDPWICELLSTRLTVLGYQVHAVRDGDQALARIPEFMPDAIVLDVNMPKMDGFSTLERIGRERLSRIPVLMLTARHGTDDVRRALSLGARDYLAKPFDEAQLILRVTRLMRKPRGRTMAVH